MALETLKQVSMLSGELLTHINDKEEATPPDQPHILVDHNTNIIIIRLQNGPIKEVGVNGAQIDILGHILVAILEKLNSKFPCRENVMAIKSFEVGLAALRIRTERRCRENTEGTNKEKEDA